MLNGRGVQEKKKITISRELGGMQKHMGKNFGRRCEKKGKQGKRRLRARSGPEKREKIKTNTNTGKRVPTKHRNCENFPNDEEGNEGTGSSGRQRSSMGIWRQTDENKKRKGMTVSLGFVEGGCSKGEKVKKEKRRQERTKNQTERGASTRKVH